MKRYVCLAFLLVATARIGRAEPVRLSFDTFSPPTNVPNMRSGLGPGYTLGPTMCFLGVATHEGRTIDARVTAVVQPNTKFASGAATRTACGYIPNYKATTAGQPKGDLGLLYDGFNKDNPGVVLTLCFFDGTGDRRGRFRDPYSLPDLSLLVYDVDGESDQAECFEAFHADGLYSYATGDAPASVTAAPIAGGVHFRGPGKDFAETDTSGAVLLRYHDTSSITLAFGAEQRNRGKNPVFSAIDGDMSVPVTGTFHEPTVVSAPAAVPPAAPKAPALSSASAVSPAGSVLRLDRSMPAEVRINVPFDYTLKVTNTTENPVRDVVVTESLPANFKVQSSDPESQRDGDKLVWTVGSLDPKASREMRISGLATAADNLKPCATVTFVVSASACSEVAVVEPKLTLTATAPAEVLLCDPIPAQIVVTNAGTGVLEGIKIVDTLPDGVTTIDGRSELVLEVGTLTPGQSKQFEDKLKASKTGEFINRVVASASGGLTAEAAATTFVRQPVLAITKAGPARQYLGRQITYEIAVTNKGDAPAGNTIVEDAIPQGAQAIQTSPAGAVSASKVVWQLGTLGVNASEKVRVTYIPAGTGPLAQAATASAICAAPVTATAETTIYGIAAVLLEVIDTEDPVPIGGQTTYLITATNQGSSPSNYVQVTAVVEDAEEIIATDGPTPLTVEGNTAKSMPLASLAPQAKATWRITVKARRPGDVRFRATMTTAELGRNVEETEATQLYE